MGPRSQRRRQRGRDGRLGLRRRRLPSTATDGRPRQGPRRTSPSPSSDERHGLSDSADSGDSADPPVQQILRLLANQYTNFLRAIRNAILPVRSKL